MNILLLSRINLAITSVVFLAYGVGPVFDPASAASVLGLSIATLSGTVSIRAIYGGYLIGAGLLFAITALKTSYTRLGLFALLLVVAPIFVSRCAGLLIISEASVDQLMRLAMEFASILITILLFNSFSQDPARNE